MLWYNISQPFQNKKKQIKNAKPNACELKQADAETTGSEPLTQAENVPQSIPHCSVQLN